MKRLLFLTAILLLGVLSMHAQRRYDCTLVLLLNDDGSVYITESRLYDGQKEKEGEPTRHLQGVKGYTAERDTLSMLLLHGGDHSGMKRLRVLVSCYDSDKQTGAADARLRLTGTTFRTMSDGTYVGFLANGVNDDAEIRIEGTLRRGFLASVPAATKAETATENTKRDTAQTAAGTAEEAPADDLTSSHFYKYDKDEPLSIGVILLMLTMVVLPFGFFLCFKVDFGLGGYVIMGFFNAIFFLWDVITLKHLRRFLNRIKYSSLSGKKSKYLPMMGGLVETQMLRRQITPVRLCMNSKLWKAMIWRMVAHGDLSLGTDQSGKVTLLPTWQGGTGDGMDRRVMQYMYDIITSKTDEHSGSLTPWSTMKAIFGNLSTSNYDSRKYQKAMQSSEELMFLLRKDVKLNKRKKEPIRQIAAFRRYLKGIKRGADPSLDLSRLWGDYVAFACLFGIESRVLRDVLALLRSQGKLSGVPLMLAESSRRRDMVKSVARAAAIASPCVNIQGIRSFGLLPIARVIHENLDEPLS